MPPGSGSGAASGRGRTTARPAQRGQRTRISSMKSSMTSPVSRNRLTLPPPVRRRPALVLLHRDAGYTTTIDGPLPPPRRGGHAEWSRRLVRPRSAGVAGRSAPQRRASASGIEPDDQPNGVVAAGIRQGLRHAEQGAPRRIERVFAPKGLRPPDDAVDLSLSGRFEDGQVGIVDGRAGVGGRIVGETGGRAPYHSRPRATRWAGERTGAGGWRDAWRTPHGPSP